VDKLAYLKASLTGDVGQILWDTDTAATDTIEKLTTLLSNRYSGNRQSDKYRMELRLRRRRHGKSLSSLHQDIRRLMALAYPTLQQDARETIACDHYIDALDDAEFGLKVRERAPGSLDDALRISLQLEAWMKNAMRNRRDNSTKPKVRVADATESGDSQLNARMNRLEGDVARCLNELVRLNQRPTQGAVANDSHPIDMDAKHNPKATQTGTYRDSRRSKLVCWGCGLVGHVQRNCAHPKPQPSKRNTEAHHETSNPIMRGSKGLDRDPVYVGMNLEGKMIPCLLDTGCDITLFPKDLVDAHHKSIKVMPTCRQLQAANDTEIKITKEVTLPLMLNGCRIRTQALVSPDVGEVMLGADWLHDHRCVWDFANRKIFIDGCAAIPLARRRSFRCRRVILQDDAVLPPRQEIDVTARAPILGPHPVGRNHIVDSRRVRPGLYVGRTLLPATHRNLRVRMVNTTAKPQRLFKGTCLGNLSPVEVVEGANADQNDAVFDAPVAHPNPAAVQAEVTKALIDKLPDDLTVAQRNQVTDLLREYDDIFSKDPYDIRRTTLVDHSIDTGDHRTFRQELRCHPVAHLNVIDNQVDEMVRHDIVEPAASPWASNVVLVRKKDSSCRWCVDYRALNSVTYKDTYPLPHIDTCLGSMDGAVWFSTLDLRSGIIIYPLNRMTEIRLRLLREEDAFGIR